MQVLPIVLAAAAVVEAVAVEVVVTVPAGPVGISAIVSGCTTVEKMSMATTVKKISIN